MHLYYLKHNIIKRIIYKQYKTVCDYKQNLTDLTDLTVLAFNWIYSVWVQAHYTDIF